MRAFRLTTTVLAILLAATVVASCSDDGPSTDATATTAKGSSSLQPIVFGAEGNHLYAYDTEPDSAGRFANQRVVQAHDGSPKETSSPNGTDINAQICFFDDHPGWFIAGEDTNQPSPPPGWGIFQLKGDTVGSMSATQIGKLTPTYQPAVDNPENYGCGELSDGRVLTTDVGNQAEGTGDGQLIVWFPPFDSRDVKYCKLDVGLATAQSILVGPDDTIYVASSRGDVYQYKGPFPTGPDAKSGCGKTDSTGAPMADSVNKSTFIAGAGANDLATPAGLAWAPDGGFYVSSVFNGVINEYRADGSFVRTILRPPAGEKLGDTSYSTGTPLGIGTGPDGTIYYADINVIAPAGKTPGPGNQTGSVRRITFKDGQPQPPETMSTMGLAFPDGIGVYDPGKKTNAAKP